MINDNVFVCSELSLLSSNGRWSVDSSHRSAPDLCSFFVCPSITARFVRIYHEQSNPKLPVILFGVQYKKLRFVRNGKLNFDASILCQSSKEKVDSDACIKMI